MEYRKTVVIGDIHGCYNTLVSLLKNKELGVDFEKDRIIFLGDYIDRGNFSVEVVSALKQLQEYHPDNIICLKGNHEDMCCRYYSKGEELWFRNSGQITYTQLENAENRNVLIEWMKNLPLLYEIEEFAFCHSGNYRTDYMFKYPLRLCLWDRDWLYYGEYNNSKKPVIFGHTPHREPAYYNDNICIDTGVCFPDKDGGNLTAVVISKDNKVSFLSEAVNPLDVDI